MSWWPAAAWREMAAEMREAASLTNNCDMTRYGFLSTRYKDQRFAGNGANGCVVLAHDSLARNVEVAIKIAKQTGRLKMWKDECARARSIHEKACKIGGEAKALVERYIPTCLEVGGTNEAPYIVMHAASGQGINLRRPEVLGDRSAAVFAQIVGALAAMHGVGLSHNDLHDNNIVILDRMVEEQESPLVAFIDFGEVVPLNKGVYKGGYKMDENLLARVACKLARCPDSAVYPQNVENINVTERDARVHALFKCLKEEWSEEKDHSNISPDEQFFNSFREVIVEAWENQNWPPIEVQETKVLDLYHTEFIQANQPALHQLFPSASAGVCVPPRMTHEPPVEVIVATTPQRVTPETTRGESKQVKGQVETSASSTPQSTTTSVENQESTVVRGSMTPTEVARGVKQDITVVDGTTMPTADDMVRDEKADASARFPKIIKSLGNRQMVCGTLLPLMLLGPVVNGVAL
eukprot:CAMPEP_0172685060 /NCGR_PEP_ID=MMETSP1074-20121228/19983_1 /TAXON_ID=2916 /ORGANISM="Ceratium fusus, Strain PA161109" /LENGTH=465 /DNA_ID=CAMNT_0013504153 /DNA_START=22 /DNA_END=1419 /DNA_ORIENTATION=-